MKFTSKTFKLGNSISIYIPKKAGLELGKVYTFEVLEDKDVYTEPPEKVITSDPLKQRSKNVDWCNKHDSFKCTCGCK